MLLNRIKTLLNIEGNENLIYEIVNITEAKILNYINVFRGLAILLIVAGHTMQFGEIGSLTQKLSVEIFAGGTALFIFISGFLFQHLSGKYEFKNYLDTATNSFATNWNKLFNFDDETNTDLRNLLGYDSSVENSQTIPFSLRIFAKS